MGRVQDFFCAIRSRRKKAAILDLTPNPESRKAREIVTLLLRKGKAKRRRKKGSG